MQPAVSNSVRTTVDRPSAGLSVGGIVLAGGLSRRMGGGHKCLCDLGGRPMLDHVLARFAPQVEGLAINANGPPGPWTRFGHDVVPDTVPGHPGPLAGVLAGLIWARSALPETTHIASVPADAPVLPLDLVARLADGLRASGHPIALARSFGRLHPVVGLWPLALADDLGTAIDAGIRKVGAWAETHGFAAVDFASEPGLDSSAPVDPFFNANTPGDLDLARRIVSASMAPALSNPK